MGKEALDAVKDERPYAGVHILATALLCAAGSSADELELARRLLARDPIRDEPRENESVAGTFNRHMDAAIDSANDSVGEGTRVGRRARMAADLDRAGLVLMDRGQVAELLAVVHELRDDRDQALIAADVCSMSLVEAVEHLKGQIAELVRWPRDDGEDLGAELLADEPCSNPHCAELDNCLECGKRSFLPASVEHG